MRFNAAITCVFIRQHFLKIKTKFHQVLLLKCEAFFKWLKIPDGTWKAHKFGHKGSSSENMYIDRQCHLGRLKLL